MPLNSKGHKILAAMEKSYGPGKKAKSVLYASKNKGTISGIDAAQRRYLDACARGDCNAMASARKRMLRGRPVG
jgi:hypothetical protein